MLSVALTIPVANIFAPEYIFPLTPTPPLTTRAPVEELVLELLPVIVLVPAKKLLILYWPIFCVTLLTI